MPAARRTDHRFERSRVDWCFPFRSPDSPLMNRIYCTIVTPDYIDRAVAILLSLREVQDPAPLAVLVTGDFDELVPDMEVVTLRKLAEAEPLAATISARYADQPDALRWSLKPVFAQYLLDRDADSGVLYVDADFCFFNTPDYLFDHLATGGVVLTPHWRPLSPTISVGNFRLNFRDGMFNAGCFAASTRGHAALAWWANACAASCELDREQGLYYDQRYLDLMPLYFPDTVICRHLGYNAADWNAHLRKTGPHGPRVVPDDWPIVLVHFTENTVKKIEFGQDPVLEPFLERYRFFRRRATQVLKTRGRRTRLNKTLRI